MSTVNIIREQAKILQWSVLEQRKFNKRMIKSIAALPEFSHPSKTALLNEMTKILCPSIIENPDDHAQSISVSEVHQMIDGFDPYQIEDETMLVLKTNSLSEYRSLLTTEVLAVAKQLDDQNVAQYWLDQQMNHLEEVQLKMHFAMVGGSNE